MCKRRVAFSGTVEIPCALPIDPVTWATYTKAGETTTVKNDTYGWEKVNTGSTEKPKCDTPAKEEFEAVILRAAEKGAFFIAPTKNTQADALALLRSLVAEGVRCVVDACGLFAGMSAKAVAKQIIGGEAEVEAVYMDETRKLQNGSCTGGACMYYFNQQSSRGVDIKMWTKIEGILLLREDEATLTDTAQAAYRMRLVNLVAGAKENYVHSFRFIVIGTNKATAAAAVHKGAQTEENTTALREAKAEVSGAIVARLIANERGLATKRAGLHREQTKKFLGRVAAINEPAKTAAFISPSYEEILSTEQITEMLQPVETGDGTQTSTSTSTSIAAQDHADPQKEIVSSWYPSFSDMAQGYSSNIQTKTKKWLSFVTGLPSADKGATDSYNDENLLPADRYKARSLVVKEIYARVRPLREIEDSAGMAYSSAMAHRSRFRADTDTGVNHKVLGMLISELNRKNWRGTVRHYTLTSEDADAAILDPVDPRRYESPGDNKTNMQRVIHLAQNSALFRPSAAYASTVTQKAAFSIPMTPPATAILYTLMGKAQSVALTDAIVKFERLYGGLQVTTRMFLCHTRMPPEHCVVIVHTEEGKDCFVLATCADLLLAEIRALRDARVYFHSEGNVLIRNMDLLAVEEAKLPAALYLIASVGAVLNEEDQVSALTVIQNLDSVRMPGIFSLCFFNKDSTTRPSRANALVWQSEHVSSFITYQENRWTPDPMFGRKHRYV
jgi:hypothetical protein